MTQKHKEKFDKKKVEIINVVSFLVGFSQAAVIYVLSTYFKEASGTENIGLFYAFSYLVILFVLLNAHKLTKKLGKGQVFIFSIFAKLVANIFLLYVAPSYWSVAIMMAYLIFTGMEWANLDVILETYSKDKMSGRIRGLHLTMINAGFLFGPFISTWLLDNFNFHGVFVFSLILNCFIFLVSLIGFRGINERFRQDLKVFDLIKKVLKRKDLSSIYYISFILEFFYALMVVYTPIYLTDLGFSWNEIGKAFTIMLIPFVILQYPAGVLADKKIGEKKIMVAAIIIMSVSTLFFFLFSSKAIFLWSAVLFATRIGAALIEILRDSYFYKMIDGRDVDLINFFRTATPLAYIIATLMSFFVLTILPLRIIFLLVALVSISAIFPALRLKKLALDKK